MSRRETLAKALNYRALSKATGLPREILKTFVKELVKQNSKEDMVRFYIDFLIFLHEEDMYVPIDVVTSFYKKKKFIDFKPLIEDKKLMKKFKVRNEKIKKELDLKKDEKEKVEELVDKAS